MPGIWHAGFQIMMVEAGCVRSHLDRTGIHTYGRIFRSDGSQNSQF